jgi:hypothetical protein
LTSKLGCTTPPDKSTGGLLPNGKFQLRRTQLHRYPANWTKTLKNWCEEFTSGVLEGFSNAMRGTIGRAFGYHVFENFRLYVIVEHGKLPTPPPLI